MEMLEQGYIPYLFPSWWLTCRGRGRHSLGGSELIRTLFLITQRVRASMISYVVGNDAVGERPVCVWICGKGHILSVFMFCVASVVTTVMGSHAIVLHSHTHSSQPLCHLSDLLKLLLTIIRIPHDSTR